MNKNDPKPSQDPKPWQDPKHDPKIFNSLNGGSNGGLHKDQKKPYSSDSIKSLNEIDPPKDLKQPRIEPLEPSHLSEPRESPLPEKPPFSENVTKDYKHTAPHIEEERLEKDSIHKDSIHKDSMHKDKYKKAYNEVEDKVKDTFKNLKDSEIYHYASSNKEQTVTYILLALGIILLFVNPLFGGLILGGVAGYHFAPQIIYYLRNLNQIFEGQDQLRYIVMTALIIGLFIAAPGIFVGAVIAAAFTQLIFSKNPTIDRDLANPNFKKNPKDKEIFEDNKKDKDNSR